MKFKFATIMLFLAMYLIVAAGCAQKKIVTKPQAIVIEENFIPAKSESYFSVIR